MNFNKVSNKVSNQLFNKISRYVGMICLCGAVTVLMPLTAKAAELGPSSETSTEMVAKIDSGSVSVYTAQNESAPVLTQAAAGSTYDVLSSGPDGWVRIMVDGQEGYIRAAGNVTVAETTKQTENKEVSVRQQVVDYALQFVGGRYVYGGNDPHTGVDCSGFTRYVMQHAAGVNMNRSSGSQASQGRSISAAEIQPGDLLFYSSGKRINHVALYIGNGQIVHASTERTGIKISNWTYRTPAKIISVL